MPTETNSELSKLKSELRNCKRQLKQATAFNERLLSVIGQDELGNWRPYEGAYGWVHAWIYPLYSFLNEQLGTTVTPDTRNTTVEIVTAIISRLAVQGKHGINLPFDPRPVDGEHYFQKQENIFRRTYPPCSICGENRITHDCHILPSAEGGPLHRDNLIPLCPLHHHLFDHHRLTQDEWEKLKPALEGKMDAAVVYAYEVRLRQQRSFWGDRSDNEG